MEGGQESEGGAEEGEMRICTPFLAICFLEMEYLRKLISLDLIYQRCDRRRIATPGRTSDDGIEVLA